MPTPLRSVVVERIADMNFYDALKLLREGVHIARRSWPERVHLQLHAGCVHLHNADGSLSTLIVSDGDMDAEDWYVVREP